MPAATPGIQQFLDPAGWRDHRFGLPPARWQALSGRTAWITGAGTGYGRCIAVALAAAGARVILSGRRMEKLNESIEKMRSLDIPAENAMNISVDITDSASVEAAADEVRRRYGPVNILVHSAAVSSGGLTWPLTSMSPAQWNRIIGTNVTGAWLICRAALPDMLAAGSCRVVLLTSEAGWAFTPGVGAYNVTKSALNNLGASLAAECAARYPAADVQINVLIPGEARTEMNKGSIISPYTVVPMTLALLSHPLGGPNGCFFHRDGRHFPFAYAKAYERAVL
jgi:NAD(P)-dependent dehydrogenase (short-subunit alcohol dehydrogenase family)